MNGKLATQIESTGMKLAGSLLAVDPAMRLSAARDLWARGAWAHADVISGSYGSRPSVTLDEIRTLAAAGGPIDVHLMVDDVASWVSALPCGLARITIQSERLQSSVTELIMAARQRASSVWLGVDTDIAPPPLEVAQADGVLHMLVPPGAAGHSLDHSRLVALRADRSRPIGVDGGVMTSHIGSIANAGAQYVVVGRSLFTASVAQKENAR